MMSLRKWIFIRKRFIPILSALVVIFSSVNVGAVGDEEQFDEQFAISNNIFYYNTKETCGTGELGGTGSVSAFSNPVYKESAPDPAIISGDDGMFYVYATGGVLLESNDMAHWKRVDSNWRLNGAPNEAGGAKWAPDVVKIGNKYVLTYTIPTGTPEIPGGGNPKIAYAVGNSAGGPFVFKGKLNLPYAYSIDSHIFVDDDGTPWMFWGGGAINVIKLTFDGNTLKPTGSSKQLLTRGGVGSSATIEGSWVIKRNGWYYLTYSQGHYDIKDGAPAYRVLVARSRTVNGNYTPNNSMRPILEGKSPILNPGHHSIITDSTNTDWIVYHGYYNGERQVRSLNVDRLTYDAQGWPVVNGGNGPSNSQQTGTGDAAAAATNNTSSSSCVCTTGSISSLTGSTEAEKAFNFFVGKGYSAQQTAGIVGNMKAESGVLPMRKQGTDASVKTSSKAVRNSSSGWGIVQWTPPSKMINPSLDAGKTYAQIDTLDHQLQFLWEQLEGTGTGGKISEKAAGDDLKRQTTIDGSARSFMTKFERPKDQSESAQKGRVQLANEIFGLYGNGAAPPTSPDTPAQPGGGCVSTSGGGDIVSIAQAELNKGVKEDPLGCDAGNPSRDGSCGKEVDKYTDSTLEYWCADFVSWVYNQAGSPFTGGLSGGWRIASVDGVRSWFKANGTWTDNGPGVKPKPGDVYTMGISHTGIVEKVEGDTIFTISGNTATDNTGNGNGVGRGSYKVGSSSIEGFGSLK